MCTTIAAGRNTDATAKGLGKMARVRVAAAQSDLPKIELRAGQQLLGRYELSSADVLSDGAPIRAAGNGAQGARGAHAQCSRAR